MYAQMSTQKASGGEKRPAHATEVLVKGGNPRCKMISQVLIHLAKQGTNSKNCSGELLHSEVSKQCLKISVRSKSELYHYNRYKNQQKL